MGSAAARRGVPPDGESNTLDGPIVRPLGHVASDPVVRRIGRRELYLGNVYAADPDRHDTEFTHVLSATSDRQPATTHHCPLVDGPDAEWRRFAAAADTTRDLLRRDGSVLVHCRSGVSRSSALVATALAAEAEQSFRDALTLVQRYRPVAMPHPALHELAVVYLAANP